MRIYIQYIYIRRNEYIYLYTLETKGVKFIENEMKYTYCIYTL